VDEELMSLLANLTDVELNELCDMCDGMIAEGSTL
jgi:hypothetical protein